MIIVAMFSILNIVYVILASFQKMAAGRFTYYEEELVVAKTPDVHVEQPTVRAKQKGKKRPPLLR